LQAGDATGDNEVDEDDINAIDAAWGTNPARPRFAEADLNNDGRVGVEDLTAAISNISNTTGFGAPPVYRPLGGRANGAARVEVVAPEHAGGWWSGTEAELVVRARDLQDLAGYSFDLVWDSEEMEVLESPPGPRVGEVFAPNPAGRYGRVRQRAGALSVAAARRGKAWTARGDGELLRLRIRLLGEGFPASLAVREGVLLSSDYEPTAVAVEDPWRAALPAALVLQQNYPNPFNPSTTIAFAVPAGGSSDLGGVPVRLEIYNVLGQMVRALVEEPRRPGFYRIQWDGRDGSGRAVASGLYLCRLQAGPDVRVARMTMVK
ncbi:MAG: FlgD immunoglobulin-like domain containing protein, partial [Gemmatimonadota bacterium]